MIATVPGRPRTIASGVLIASCLLIAGAGACFAAEAPKEAPASKTTEVYRAWPFDAKEATKRQEETAKALGVPKEKKIALGAGVEMKFVLIPAGTYKDDGGQEVTIAKPFYLGKFAVTQAQYAAVMRKNPSKHSGALNPVDSVDWAPATEFARKVSEKSEQSVRLPREAEWEWACRAGTATRAYWGDDMAVLGDYCWWHDNCNMTTHPVGLKKPNAFGLYDMMGNVWEWCSEGGGPEATDHPCRGATFGSKVPMFHSSVRITGGVGSNDRFGFRVAMDVE